MSPHTVQAFRSSEPCLRPGGFQHRRSRFASFHRQSIHLVAASGADHVITFEDRKDAAHMRSPRRQPLALGWLGRLHRDQVYVRGHCGEGAVMLDVTRMWRPYSIWRPQPIGSTLIVGFADRRTETFYRGGRVAAFSGFARTASRKLDQLDAATGLRDLSRPGNRLEALKGRRKGQWSIRINDQWRVCFKWPEGSPGPTDVEIVDYH